MRQHSEGLYLIPSSVDMFRLPRKLNSERAAHERLRRVLRHLDDTFDVCLIDCRPGLDVDTDAALYAAQSVLVPVDVDEFSIEALSQLLAQMQTLEQELEQPSPQVLGLVVNRVIKPLSAINLAVMEQLRDSGLPVLAEIPIRSILAEARNSRLTITQYLPKSDTAQMFRDLAKTSGLVAALMAKKSFSVKGVDAQAVAVGLEPRSSKSGAVAVRDAVRLPRQFDPAALGTEPHGSPGPPGEHHRGCAPGRGGDGEGREDALRDAVRDGAGADPQGESVPAGRRVQLQRT